MTVDSEGLTPRERYFVEAYLASFNATRAYQEAGYTAKSDAVAAAGASRVLRKVKVAGAIRTRLEMALDDGYGEAQKRLLHTLIGQAFGDPGELVETRLDCCRYCYGKDYKYLFTPAEYQAHQDAYRLESDMATKNGLPPPMFNPKGGVGFSPRLDPCPDCPECHGRGVSCVIMKDTRHLSPAGRTLYAGVRETKEGLEVKLHDQVKARELLSRVFRLDRERIEVDLAGPTTDQLDRLYKSALLQAEESRLAMLKRREVS